MENATVINISEAAKAVLSFSWIDYTIFFLMFGISTLIGIYFGCFGTKQSTTNEYLLGSRAMGVFPIAISLTASHLSGITLLGFPSEIYMFGTQITACMFTAALVSIIIVYVYLPVFYMLKVNSSYEYLKLRFSEKIRTMALILYVIQCVLHIPLIIYVPALAFNQVSGMDIHKITPIICAICIFYTTIGGLKGVVWSDTIQFMMTLGTMLTVFFIGIYSVGGISNIWESSLKGDRIEFFNMDLNPTSRTTFWGVIFGLGIHWIATLGINPSSVQRFLAVPSIEKAKITVLIFGLGVIITKLISCFFGLIIYTKYKDCDPYSSGKVNRLDQILPYYVLDVAKNIPGLPGLFVTGICSTAFSTMSTNLNTLSGTIYEDFIKKYLPKKDDDRTANNIIKATVVIIGVICVLMVFFVEHLGNVLQISAIFHGVTVGPLMGLFTLGMLFPSANAKGALFGSIAGLAGMSCIFGGFQYHHLNGNIKYAYRPLSIEKCDNITSVFKNVTSSHERLPIIKNDPFFIFRLSFYWHPVIGAIIVLVTGLIVSWISKEENPNKYNKDFYSPVIHRFLSEKPKEYKAVALKIVNNKITEDGKK